VVHQIYCFQNLSHLLWIVVFRLAEDEHFRVS